MSSSDVEGAACIMKHACTKAAAVHTEDLTDDLKEAHKHVDRKYLPLFGASRYNSAVRNANLSLDSASDDARQAFEGTVYYNRLEG